MLLEGLLSPKFNQMHSEQSKLTILAHRAARMHTNYVLFIEIACWALVPERLRLTPCIEWNACMAAGPVSKARWRNVKICLYHESIQVVTTSHMKETHQLCGTQLR